MSIKLLGTPRTLTPELANSFKTGDVLASNEKAKRELGWAQNVPLEQSLQDTMDELKGQLNWPLRLPEMVSVQPSKRQLACCQKGRFSTVSGINYS